MKKNGIALTIGIMCFLLVFGICIQLKTIEASSSVTKSISDNSLRDEVLKWKDRYDSCYRDLQQAEKRLENERKKATENDAETSQMEKELSELNKLLGLTDVSGKGVIITVEDNQQDSTLITDANASVVHDGDLIEIVNILKNAGAEAISINDQRITGDTAITCDGTVVRVNNEKIGSPFNIKAIGSPQELKESLEMPKNYIDQMRKDGVKVDIKISNNIKIEKYDGIIENIYLRNR